MKLKVVSQQFGQYPHATWQVSIRHYTTSVYYQVIRVKFRWSFTLLFTLQLTSYLRLFKKGPIRCNGISPRYQVLTMDFKKRAKAQRCCYYCQALFCWESCGSLRGPLVSFWITFAYIAQWLCMSLSVALSVGTVEILSWLRRRVAFKSQCKLGQCWAVSLLDIICLLNRFGVVILACTQQPSYDLSHRYHLSSTQRYWTYTPHTAHGREPQLCSVGTGI
jgi:hypothetical protein